MVNYIILVILGVVLILSIILVIAENFVLRNSNADRFMRPIRIRLREKSRTSFCLGTIVLLILGLVTGDGNFSMIWLAIGIMLLNLVILHPEDFVSVFRTRRKAAFRKKISRTPLIINEISELPMLAELTQSNEN